jgi:hypothetical protein
MSDSLVDLDIYRRARLAKAARLGIKPKPFIPNDTPQPILTIPSTYRSTPPLPPVTKVSPQFKPAQQVTTSWAPFDSAACLIATAMVGTFTLYQSWANSCLKGVQPQ